MHRARHVGCQASVAQLDACVTTDLDESERTQPGHDAAGSRDPDVVRVELATGGGGGAAGLLYTLDPERTMVGFFITRP